MNIKIKFKGTYLGFLWTALEPMLTFILLYVVFTSLRIRLRDDFAIYLLIGVILYHIFTRGTLSGLTSIQGHRGILKSVNFSNEFFPVSSTLTIVFQTFIEVGVFFALMPFFQFVPPWTIVFLPLVILLMIALIQGLSYFLSIVYVYVKDFQPLWSVLVHAVFFVTPIFWYVEDAGGILLDLHRINPVGQIVELGHKIVIFEQIPLLSEWLYATLLVTIIFFAGWIFFKRFEKNVVEEL